MKVQPVVVVSPWVWLLVTFWKPIVVFVLVLSVLLALMFPVVRQMALDSAARQAAAQPTLYIPDTWRASLTSAAVSTPRPRP